MCHRAGVVRDEGELKGDPRELGLRVFRDLAQEDAPRLLRARARESLEEERVEGEADAGQDGEGPQDRAAGQHSPGADEQGDRGRRDPAAAQVVEDLPLRGEGTAVWARPG